MVDTLDTVNDTKGISKRMQKPLKSVRAVISREVMGKKYRAAGKRFQTKTLEDLRSQGFIVAKWTNQVDLKEDKLILAKGKFNPFTRRMMGEIGGLPDFLCMSKVDDLYNVFGVESKMSKYLDQEEKAKLRWLLKYEIFSRIFIAYKGKNGEVEYYDFH